MAARALDRLRHLRTWLPLWLGPCLVGLASFLVVVGPRVVEPTNVGWVRAGVDSMSHYLGWAFYRQTPWTIPLGANPDFGLELGSSVLYSDSIPVFALLFKSLSPLLPVLFQYTGLWLLACFVLQSFFAWLLTGLVTPNQWLRLMSAAFFTFSPPMLFRLQAEHWSLVGHWTILAALVLVLRPGRERQGLYWAALATVATLVHMYLMVMVLALWLSGWAGDVLRGTRSRFALLGEATIVPASTLCALWQAGFFLVGSGKSVAGYGAYRLNLNALVSPWGWSYVLPTLDHREADYEGFAFLGLGGLIAVALAVPATIALWKRGGVRFRAQWAPLALALLTLTLFAVSNEVGFGLHGFSYPVPELLRPLTGMLRASGRFFWPAFYALLFAAVAAIVRAWPTRVTLVILTGVMAVQAADTAAGWRRLQPRFHKRVSPRSPLTSAFWVEAAGVYKRVRLVPPGTHAENWSVIADFAQRFRLGTDAVYIARPDAERARALWTRTMSGFVDGRFDPDTFYILRGYHARWAPCVIDPSRDRVALVDGFWVLLPGWKASFGDRFAGEVRVTCPVLGPGRAPIDFVRGSEGARALTQGWSQPEEWGTWSDSLRSVLNLDIEGPVSAIELNAAVLNRPGPPIEVQVSVNGERATTWRMAVGSDPRWYRVGLRDKGVTARRRLRVDLAFSDAAMPASYSASNDRRLLAFALYQARAVP